MLYFITFILGAGLILFGGVAVLMAITSGLGIPFLVLPLAWYLMWRHNKKIKAQEQFAAEHPELQPENVRVVSGNGTELSPHARGVLAVVLILGVVAYAIVVAVH